MYTCMQQLTHIGIMNEQGQPGPAYYNPAIPNKKSFHLNAIGRWV